MAERCGPSLTAPVFRKADLQSAVKKNLDETLPGWRDVIMKTVRLLFRCLEFSWGGCKQVTQHKVTRVALSAPTVLVRAESQPV